MPNRILKESICTSENIDSLSAFHETVFYRLIVNCDDYGRLDARPKLLAAKLFPLKDIRAAQIEDALRALTSAELVTLYVVDGKPFLQMNTWDRHQQVRAKKSKYPPMESGMRTNDITCKQMISDACKCPRNPIQSNTHTDIDPPHETRTREGRWFDPENPDEDCDTGWLSDKGRGAVAQRIMDWACKREGFSTLPEEDEHGQVGAELYAMIAGAMRNGIHPATITKALADCDGLASAERQVAALIKGQVGIDGLRTISEAWGERAWAEYQAELQNAAAWM